MTARNGQSSGPPLAAPSGPESEWETDWLPERSDKVAEIIARRIVRDIARSGLAPGTMLPPEAVMLQRFRVGRASLREALRLLEVYGLIAIKPGPGGGPVVQDVTSREFARAATFYFHLHGSSFRDLLDARCAIEPLMARLAASGGDPAALLKLERDQAAARQAFEQGDREAWIRLTREFHSQVAGASGNRILDLFGASLKELYHERMVVGRIEPLDNAAKVVHEHEAVTRAILDGRADDAERLMQKHMESFTAITMKGVPGLLDDVLDWR
ncbi:MAG TPA: FadR/GntR family transcriptional regulator [Acidimicrobiales bacterium]|jgi:DNA-binding FadR family transcriptional regulator